MRQLDGITDSMDVQKLPRDLLANEEGINTLTQTYNET